MLGAPPQPGREWIGWVAVAFFGIAALAWGRRLFDRRPLIVVDAQGVLWRDFSDDVIPWSRISGWTMQDVVTTKFVCLDLVDAASFPRTGMASMAGGANRGVGHGDAQIHVTGTDRSFDELVAAMQHFRPA